MGAPLSLLQTCLIPQRLIFTRIGGVVNPGKIQLTRISFDLKPTTIHGRGLSSRTGVSIFQPPSGVTYKRFISLKAFCCTQGLFQLLPLLDNRRKDKLHINECSFRGLSLQFSNSFFIVQHHLRFHEFLLYLKLSHTLLC